MGFSAQSANGIALVVDFSEFNNECKAIILRSTGITCLLSNFLVKNLNFHSNCKAACQSGNPDT